MENLETARIVQDVSKIVRCVASPSDAFFPRVAFGKVIYNPGGFYGYKKQKYFQLCGVIEGEVDIKAGHRITHIGAGEIALRQPGIKELQRFSSTQKTYHVWCALSPGMLAGPTLEACHNATEVLPMTRRMEQLIESGLSMPQGETRPAQDLLEALGMAALREYLFVDACRKEQKAEPPDALRHALEWIELNGQQPIDLDGFAQKIGVSPEQLIKLFKRHLNTTPMHYLWKARARFGVQLLRETSLPITEIAYRAGFQTSCHFSRHVRQHFGLAPRKLRARLLPAGPPVEATLDGQITAGSKRPNSEPLD